MGTLLARCKNAIRYAVPPAILRWKLPADAEESILFTFDDGPDTGITGSVLDLLRKHDARAAFFVIGDRINAENEHVLRRIVEEGHVLGNHSFTHSPENRPGVGQYRHELTACQDRIVAACGVAPVLFRPPRGIVSFSALVSARMLGLKTVLWSRASGEYGDMKGCTAEQMSERLLRTIRGRDIVLMHDISEDVPQILETLLPVLKAKGMDLANGVDKLLV